MRLFTQQFAVPVVIFFAFTLAMSVTGGNDDYFSQKSLDTLQRLNRVHKVYLDNLLDQNNPALGKEIIAANVFQEPHSASEGSSLIAYARNGSSSNGAFLLLRTIDPVPDDQLHNLANEYKNAIPEFVNVEVDQPIQMTSVRAIDAWMEVASGRAFPMLSQQTTEPVRVAVIDSGIDASHDFFSDKHVASGWNFIDGDNSMYDDIGHGTHIAGLIFQQDSDVEIIPYKVTGLKGGKLSHVLKALSKATDDKVNLINMSFGFPKESFSLQKMVEKATDNHIVIVAAAGNHNTSAPYYPAFYDPVIAVAAVDFAHEKTKTSNYGEWIDAAAPGLNAYSSVPHNLYAKMSGTSQAAAVMTGYVARAMEKGQIGEETSADDIDAFIRAQARFFGKDMLDGIPLISI